jgi:hypothetical protein
MGKMEQLELDAHRNEIDADMRSLVEKYRRVFGWDIPEIDQQAADKLILAAMRKALDDIQRND